MHEKFLVEVEHVSKKFCVSLKKSLWYGVQDIGRELFLLNHSRTELRNGEFWALKDISLELPRGEALGLIGRNGAGKTTLLRLLNGLIRPDSGRIVIRGKAAALIELGVGFDPILTGRENIYVNAAVLGLAKRDVDRILDEIIDFAEIPDFIDMPVQSYSAGMRVRLGFAIAAHLNPDVLLVDEVLAVGDVGFQRKCLQHVMKYLRSGGSLILVSHNMHLIQSICQRCLFLDRGQIQFEGVASEAVDAYFRLQDFSAEQFATGNQPELDERNPVGIEKIDVFPVDGSEIRSGGDVRLILYYNSTRDISPVTWGFSVWTRDQVVRITTCVAKYAGKVHRLVKGKGSFSCIVPKIDLAPGTYALKAGIYDVETAWPIARIGWETTPVYFCVENPLSEAYNRHRIDGDIVTMDVKWDG